MNAHDLLEEAKKSPLVAGATVDDHSLMAVPRAPVRAGDVAGVIALCENRAAYVIFVELAEAGDAKHAADVADEQSGAGLYRGLPHAAGRLR